jgi:hypothetical protein
VKETLSSTYVSQKGTLPVFKAATQIERFFTEKKFNTEGEGTKC